MIFFLYELIYIFLLSMKNRTIKNRPVPTGLLNYILIWNSDWNALGHVPTCVPTTHDT